MDMKVKKIDQNDIVECFNHDAHVDDYVKAVMFCCSCESYLCYNCDLAKHSNDDNKGLDMHIRIPISSLGDEEDDHDHNTVVGTKKNEEEEEKKRNSNKLLENAKGKEKEKRNSFSFKKKENVKEKEKEKEESVIAVEKDPFDENLVVGDSPFTLVDTDTNDNNEKTTDEQKQKEEKEIEGITLNLEGVGLKKEKEVTFNNMFEMNQRSNTCGLEEGEEDNEINAMDVPMSDSVEASNIVQGVVEGVIELGTGIADGVTGVIADPVNGARAEGVKGFFKGVGRGLSGVALKPVRGAAGLVGKVAEGVRNTPEAIFTPSHQHVDVIKEKEATHFLDGLYQGTLGLGKGIFEGVTGVVVEPIRGAQEKGGVGFIQGVGKGLLGVVCKPISGAMDFVSKPIEGLANTPQTIIDAIDERKMKKEALAKHKKQIQQEKDEKLMKDDMDQDDEYYLDDNHHNNQKNDTKLLDKQNNNNNNNNINNNNNGNGNGTPEQEKKKKFSPSMVGLSPKLTSRSESQKEFNEKWLSDNKSLGKDTISSTNFSK
ncbi:hypothetical protein DFA_00130 [Cavenderia fasciculata]|uniref:B box-type domain-containing protein n=1 Tax=Cavenderia fasciculata TaxID=261658 RepID=F4PXP2_CACFS|nr:uncharacterized protein DFA_00130 [Cavenderia fasciculata]EGG19552.1 hypothetical protein DFA_00130 [Cavenderia fasciculata]|eukprot:XP_004357846.1 hypothetical protein DFA_00130 [Cavenderia fasciculata]